MCNRITCLFVLTCVSLIEIETSYTFCVQVIASEFLILTVFRSLVFITPASYSGGHGFEYGTARLS
jgi:hypothetical protein